MDDNSFFVFICHLTDFSILSRMIVKSQIQRSDSKPIRLFSLLTVHNKMQIKLNFRYNELAVEKQRVDQENNSLRLYVDEERKEKEEMRRQQQVRSSQLS